MIDFLISLFKLVKIKQSFLCKYWSELKKKVPALHNVVAALKMEGNILNKSKQIGAHADDTASDKN